MRGDGGVAGEGRVVGVPKFHSWGKCTMSLTNINSDWMSNASSGLRIILYYLFILRGSFKLHLGVTRNCHVTSPLPVSQSLLCSYISHTQAEHTA